MNTRRTLRQAVRERGQALRLLPYERLLGMKYEPAEPVAVGGRAGTVATYCRACDQHRVAVVLRATLDTWLPRDMPDDELYDYDPLFSN